MLVVADFEAMDEQAAGADRLADAHVAKEVHAAQRERRAPARRRAAERADRDGVVGLAETEAGVDDARLDGQPVAVVDQQRAGDRALQDDVRRRHEVVELLRRRKAEVAVQRDRCAQRCALAVAHALAAGVERAAVELQARDGGTGDQWPLKRWVAGEEQALQAHGQRGDRRVGRLDGAKPQRRGEQDRRALAGGGADDERLREIDRAAARRVLRRGGGEQRRVERVHEAVENLDDDRSGGVGEVVERVLQRRRTGCRPDAPERFDLLAGELRGRRLARHRVRADRADRAVRVADEDPRPAGDRVAQRLVLGRRSDAEQHAPDARVDHDLVRAERTTQPLLPRAQVVAAKAPDDRAELRGIGQVELQADVGHVQAAGRRRRRVEAVDGHVGIGVGGRRAARQPRLEHRSRHGVGCGQRVDGRGHVERRGAVGVEELHGQVARVELEAQREARQAAARRRDGGPEALVERHHEPDPVGRQAPEEDRDVRQVRMHGAVVGALDVGQVAEGIERRPEHGQHRGIAQRRRPPARDREARDAGVAVRRVAAGVGTRVVELL